MSQREQVAVTSRIFCLAAVFGFAVVGGDSAVIQTVVAVMVVGAMSGYLSYAIGKTGLPALTAETLVVALPDSSATPKTAARQKTRLEMATCSRGVNSVVRHRRRRP